MTLVTVVAIVAIWAAGAKTRRFLETEETKEGCSELQGQEEDNETPISGFSEFTLIAMIRHTRLQQYVNPSS